MNNLLIYFAFPISTIIFSIVLQKILRNEFLTASTIFAAFLIATFSTFDANFLIYTIAYTILAYIIAVLTKYLIRFIEQNNENEENDENNCQCLNNRGDEIEEKNLNYNYFNNESKMKNNRNYNCMYRR